MTFFFPCLSAASRTSSLPRMFAGIGLIVGALLPLIRPQMRRVVGVAAPVVLGTTATVASGEYKIGWEFLLIDIHLSVSPRQRDS